MRISSRDAQAGECEVNRLLEVLFCADTDGDCPPVEFTEGWEFMELPKKHNHKEAFCLMSYSCTSCGHAESIWNSRDGVTPFGTRCPSCGEQNLVHINWQLDRYIPDYKLIKYQKFWRDGTKEEAIEVINKRIKNHPDMPKEVQESLLQDASNLTGSWQKGWPRLDVYMGD